MNKGTRRVKLDMVAELFRTSQIEALNHGVDLVMLDPCGPSGHPECALYGPQETVNLLLARWGYDQEGR